jgi:enoyl-CoA hydratase
LRCVIGAGGAPLEEPLAAERAAVKQTLGTPDQIEGIKAFLEKRRPVFNQS